LAVTHLSGQRPPRAEQVRSGLAQKRSGQDPLWQAHRQRPQPAQRTGKLFASEFGADIRLGAPGLLPRPLPGVKSADQLECHPHRLRVFRLRYKKLPPHVRPTAPPSCSRA
jgi:hypothetical protein